MTNKKKPLHPETLAATAGFKYDASTGGVVPPIHLATTYARGAGYQLIGSADYTRDKNPTPVVAEELLAALEGGAAALTFGSGMAAATAAFRSLVHPGDRAIVPRTGYFAFRNWAVNFGARWGVGIDVVDTTNLDAVRGMLTPTTKVVWIETPANPTWEVSDIAAIAELAHRGGARVVVDSTCATPVHTRPLSLGADIVMHSATKYLGGHSDVLAGMLATAKLDDAWQAIHELRHVEGNVLAPVEAWLLQRGMRTLFARVERQSRTALALAQRLTARGVHVDYPGLPGHPQHRVAVRQMREGFGGMLSIQVAKPLELVAKLQLWTPATSLGGVESLIEHRHSVEGPNSPTPYELLRLSVGLEHADDLFDDLVQAL